MGAWIPITVFPVALSTIEMPFDPRTNSDGSVSKVMPRLARFSRDSVAYFSMHVSLQYSEGGVVWAEHSGTAQIVASASSCINTHNKELNSYKAEI